MTSLYIEWHHSIQNHVDFTMFSLQCVYRTEFMCHINPLPHMPIFGSSNSAANKDMSKI